jgi:hypothetical protein
MHFFYLPCVLHGILISFSFDIIFTSKRFDFYCTSSGGSSDIPGKFSSCVSILLTSFLRVVQSLLSNGLGRREIGVRFPAAPRDFLLMSPIFWYTTPCKPLKSNRRFGGTCCLHHPLLSYYTDSHPGSPWAHKQKEKLKLKTYVGVDV